MTVELIDLLLLCLAAFLAGFVDAIVGGAVMVCMFDAIQDGVTHDHVWRRHVNLGP